MGKISVWKLLIREIKFREISSLKVKIQLKGDFFTDTLYCYG